MPTQSKLALNGGPKAITGDHEEMFHWPIVLKEDEDAVLEVLRAGSMSGIDITQKFEAEIAEWHGMKYALGHNTGTAALHCAQFGCEIGVGDEVISPSLTYWATSLQVFSLGATIVYADIVPETLCIDPNDIEHRITDRTKAIIVVHYMGHPCDMNPILEIAKKHNLKVIEDVSHAQGALYKGRLVGTMGDVAAYSIMSQKSLACGEGGMLMTNDRKIYERAIAFGHYERNNEAHITEESLIPFMKLPLGGYKYRMHQVTSAMGRVQLKYYQSRMEEIQKAMNYFWDLLKDVPGLRAHRPPADSGTTMGGWYAARGHYVPEDLEGLPVTKYAEAVRAEGFEGISTGANMALHLHPLLNDCDVYGHSKPTRIANSNRDVRQGPGSLPVTEGIQERLVSIPNFKHYDEKIIEAYAAAFRKVSENYRELL